MLRSTDGIVTTHVGSLPRPPELLEIMTASHSAAVDTAVRDAVAATVARQAEIGIDVPSDGEMSKPSFLTYAGDRLSGFEDVGSEGAGSPFAGSRDALAHPDYYSVQSAPPPAVAAAHPVCTGPITYAGQAAVAQDIANLQAAMAASNVTEAFLPAISPGNVELWYPNRYYATDEEYLFAIAEALAVEYRAIVESGLLLQVDDPRLVTQYVYDPSLDLAGYHRWAEIRVAALNHALEGLPRDRVRFHTCYSIDMGPRTTDLPLTEAVDLIIAVNAGAYSFEAANPRHDHEWSVWRDVSLPDDTVLIPGLVTQSTVLVEHPELVAQRIERFAGVVGRERVIAGADCGFGTFAGSSHIPASVAWAKLQSIVDGARIATERLWPR